METFPFSRMSRGVCVFLFLTSVVQGFSGGGGIPNPFPSNSDRLIQSAIDDSLDDGELLNEVVGDTLPGGTEGLFDSDVTVRRDATAGRNYAAGALTAEALDLDPDSGDTIMVVGQETGYQQIEPVVILHDADIENTTVPDDKLAGTNENVSTAITGLSSPAVSATISSGNSHIAYITTDNLLRVFYKAKGGRLLRRVNIARRYIRNANAVYLTRTGEGRTHVFWSQTSGPVYTAEVVEREILNITELVATGTIVGALPYGRSGLAYAYINGTSILFAGYQLTSSDSFTAPTQISDGGEQVTSAQIAGVPEGVIAAAYLVADTTVNSVIDVFGSADKNSASVAEGIKIKSANLNAGLTLFFAVKSDGFDEFFIGNADVLENLGNLNIASNQSYDITVDPSLDYNGGGFTVDLSGPQLAKVPVVQPTGSGTGVMMIYETFSDSATQIGRIPIANREFGNATIYDHAINEKHAKLKYVGKYRGTLNTDLYKKKNGKFRSTAYYSTKKVVE